MHQAALLVSASGILINPENKYSGNAACRPVAWRATMRSAATAIQKPPASPGCCHLAEPAPGAECAAAGLRQRVSPVPPSAVDPATTTQRSDRHQQPRATRARSGPAAAVIVLTGQPGVPRRRCEVGSRLRDKSGKLVREAEVLAGRHQAGEVLEGLWAAGALSQPPVSSRADTAIGSSCNPVEVFTDYRRTGWRQSCHRRSRRW